MQIQNRIIFEVPSEILLIHNCLRTLFILLILQDVGTNIEKLLTCFQQKHKKIAKIFAKIPTKMKQNL